MTEESRRELLDRKIVTVDDVMRLSVDLIRLVKEDEIIAARVADISTDDDGTKVLHLERIGPPPVVEPKVSPKSHPSFDSFETGFMGGGSGAVRICVCGRVFYNPIGGWTFEDGEVERLEKSGATALEHEVGELELEGKSYVLDCDCWHDRALRIIGFLNAHAQSIADYLTNEKKRKTAEAIMSPIVE